jgi:xanthine dehydrogenase iron-sulfur cluster and FAD-binding subunit A
MQPKNKTLATSQPKSSALPEEWVERLFARFEAMYGAKFADAWKGCDLRNVKVVWAEALGSLRRDEITAGIAGCMTREWPPTLPEFVKLCRQPDPNAPGGHPTANEAWALVLSSHDEAQTVVWTEQIAEAAGIVQPILDAGDEVGARMAFRDAYERILRERPDSPRWFPSLGNDPVRRQDALDRAVAAGRLSGHHAAGLLPPPINAKGHVIAGLLSGDASAPMPRDPEFRRRITGPLRQIKGGEAA